MPTPTAANYRRYRAPKASGASLVEPAWPELMALVEANRQTPAACEVDGLGEPLADFAAAAREELLKLARAYTRSFCDPPALTAGAASGPIILSGHQPELFHPGVWFKNFALDTIAKSSGGVGVHLLIDSDLCRSTAVPAPTGSIEAPRLESVAYDDTAATVPHEERAVANPERLASFGERIADVLEGFIEQPLAEVMATDLVDAAGETGNLGLALSQARRRLEGRWGSATLELPLSRVCDTDAFRRFAGCLLTQLPALHAAYNGALAAYRDAHRLRTPAQPMPDLHVDGDWLETPLWVWTTDDPQRRPLFARPVADGVELTNRAGGAWRLPADSAAQAMADLCAGGVKLRSRALLTTFYARLVLGDLFLHGIGGAKYDEVTDELARRLWGHAPPPHATLSATLRLPIDYPEVDPAEDSKLRAKLRELRFHPEEFVDRSHPDAGKLIAAKRTALSAPIETSGSSRHRHQRIERANHALQRLVADQKAAIEARREALAQEQQIASVLGSREFAFCLFPESALREPLAQLASPSAD